MAKDGGKAKREDRMSGSMKRLFSPPEESHDAKRPRTTSPLTTGAVIMSRSLKERNYITEPEKTPSLPTECSAGCYDKSVGHSQGTELILNDGRSAIISVQSVSSLSLGQEKKPQQEHDEQDSGFTLITEQTAAEAETSRKLHTSVEKDTPNAHVHETSAQAITPALHGGSKEREVHPNVKETIRTSKKVGDGDQKTQDQEQNGSMTFSFIFT